jgi:hypothetical protein
VHPHSEAADITIGEITTSEYTIEHLESSTDYSVQMRARSPDAWGSTGPVLVARTGPPSRLLPAPEPPVIVPDDEVQGCTVVQLRLPRLRHGCARDDALTIEYRETGRNTWREYFDAPPDSDAAFSVVLPREHSQGSVEFRLKAHRGPLVSEASEVLGPIEACSVAPTYSAQTMSIALGIALTAVVLCTIAICRTASKAKGRPPKKDRVGMTQLKTTDDDDLSDTDERMDLSVKYELSSGEPIDGMLPLTGIANCSELLEELAEFGCELQDDVIISVSTMEASYEDSSGKQKMIGPRTNFQEVINAGEVAVVSKARTMRQLQEQPNRSANGRARVTFEP